MKTTIVLFFLSISTVFSQVDCASREQNFSGECDSYNTFSGIRSTYNYKKGELHGKFEEIYKDGQQRAVGAYKSGLLNGKFLSFYPSGEKMTVSKFKSGSGSFDMFHANGVLKTTGQFDEGKAIGNWKFYNLQGEVTREMDLEENHVDMYACLVGEQQVRQKMGFDNFFDSFDDSGFSFSFGGDADSTFEQMRQQMNESMQQLQSQMEELMQSFNDSSFMNTFQFDTTITFNGFDDMDGFFEFKSFGDSSFSKSFQFDTLFSNLPERGNPFFGSSKTDLVDFPDTEPAFIGGEEAMNAYVQSEVLAFEEGVKEIQEGTVFIEAIIEEDGTVSNSRVALGVDPAVDKVALRIVQDMPAWKPAKVNDQPVRSRCIVPVRFER
ncbi:MAG: energy transducer TonB [Crocinitomicaceae bacterium]